jgi:hypothetical protein
MNRSIDIDALTESLEQAQGILHAVIDQACLNGADVVKPAALQAALGAVTDAMEHAKPGPTVAPVPISPKPAGQPASSITRETARLTDAADATAAGTRELLAVLDMADPADMDSDTARAAVRAFAALARTAHERALDSARMAKDLYDSNRPRRTG